MKVLIACEYSGRVRDAFAAKGHDAMSCDLLPTDKPGKHYQGDVMEVINDGWDLMIAHPPCTYLCNSGVRWLYDKDKAKAVRRWEQMEDAARLFAVLLDANIPKIAVENPIMHKYAVEIIGRRQDQIIQPWMYGHTESKATGLWLKNLPELKPSNDVKEQWKALPKGEGQKIHWMSPSKERAKLRSLTYQGIADAMAEQWG